MPTRSRPLAALSVTAAALVLCPTAAVAAPAHGTSVSADSSAVSSNRTASSAPADWADTEIIGHRGAGGLAPENTLTGLNRARALGATTMEVDLQLTSDGVPVLFHDNTAARTSNAADVFPGRETAPITDFSHAELKKLDVGSYMDDRYRYARVPTLDQVRHLAGGSTTLNIELKRPVDSPGVEKVLAERLQQPGWQRALKKGHVRVLSSDVDSLKRFHELSPGTPVYPTPNAEQLDDATLADYATWSQGVLVDYHLLDQATVERIRKHGLELQACTVDSPDAMEDVLNLGVDAIYTDFPNVLGDVLQGKDPLPKANGIEVKTINGDVPGDDVQPEKGEHVVLTNTSAEPIDVSGYALQEASGVRLHVGDGYVLQPGGELNVYTGPGTNTQDRYYNGRTSALLNNGGDSVVVLSADPAMHPARIESLIRDMASY